MKFSPILAILILTVLITACRRDGKVFHFIPSAQSNIHFNNRITENDSINPFDLPNMYNGGGVGVGDFNGDGLPDLYFTGNQVSNRLYLNRGKFRFDDVTDIAGVNGAGRWCRGVSVVDINNDGRPDIYVCATLSGDVGKRQNLLYVNQGLNNKAVPVFKEMASDYGLNDTTYSTMAYFFDYDNDGDLDVYIAVNEMEDDRNPSVYRPKRKDGSSPSTGRLYRNDFSAGLGHPVFTNVSKQAGITIEGYSHSAVIADFNDDGWKDILVANDFLSNDVLYINNHDGTFSDKASEYFRHTSANGMGQDVVDINNDGLADVVEMDMDPEDNYRKKMLMPASNYQNYVNNDSFGYQYQYVRNTLQLNMGPTVEKNDSIGHPVFGDVGYFANISSTDWSWAPLVADFDNDGLRDLVITNGYPKDITDHDFIAFREKAFAQLSKKEVLSKIPQAKLKHYAYRNISGTKFSDVSTDWGLDLSSFANGAVYADLNDDGKLDLVISNVNDEAFVYENDARDTSNYLTVNFHGDSLNRNGLGAHVSLYYRGKQQVAENSPYRGYLSSVETDLHFGLGKIAKIDSLVVRWPDGKRQTLVDVNANQRLTVDHRNAGAVYNGVNQSVANRSLFTPIEDSARIYYKHRQADLIDFSTQPLMPHKFSEYGPAMAVGDLNGDSLDDLVIGGTGVERTTLLLQQKSGTFTNRRNLPGQDQKNWDDMGITIFDADGDGDADIYIASGGYKAIANSNAYRDRLYLNDGKGNFSLDTAALPTNLTSKSCVRAIDYDHDGDLDLFVAGRVLPWNYPQAVSCAIYRNDSKDGHVKFTDVTAEIAKPLINLGMVCDAAWTDFNNDGWPDLVIAGEWMPVKFLRNDHGRFSDVSAASGISDQSGFWNSITAGDFDNDGDMDYVISNLGENSFYKASEKYPVSVYAKDFYQQGITQCVITTYLKDRQDGVRKEFASESRDDLLSQLPFLKKRFLTYQKFAIAPFDKIFTPEELQHSIHYSVNNLKSCLVRNNGNGRFSLEPLCDMAQYSAINGMITDDFDGDGNLDICMNTNDYATVPIYGRYDALSGLVLKGDGTGNFSPMSMLESGLCIPGNGKALVKLQSADGRYLVAGTQNRGTMKVFQMNRQTVCVPLRTDDVSAQIRYKDGKKQKRETGYGSSFLSQSARFLLLDSAVSGVEVTNSKGISREISLQQRSN